MNPKQKLVRLIGLLALVGIAIIPPWQFSYQTKAGVAESKSVGYHPIWNPPETAHEDNENVVNARYRVNILVLGIELAAVLIALNIGVFALKTRQ